MWWLYYVLGAIIIGVVSVVYMLYRGYNRIRPKPIEGIPCPPLSHPVLGHHDMILHPLKHELRAQVGDSTRSPIFQLVMMKFASVFVNDSSLAFQVLKDLPNKGKLYDAFRYNPQIPDIIASDGNEYELRRKAFEVVLKSLSYKNTSIFNQIFIQLFDKLSISGESVDIREIIGVFVVKILCLEMFGIKYEQMYSSEDGNKDDNVLELLKALKIMTDAQISTGIYVLPDVKKVTAEDMQFAKSTWKEFLIKILALVKGNTGDSSKRLSSNVGDCIVLLMNTESTYQDNEAISDIHQLFKHSFDFITGALMWIVYSLHRYPKIRSRLEVEIESSKSSKEYCSYAEAFIKETFRRYPVGGNMTVRTVDKANYSIVGDIVIPEGTPVHIHMFSYHNSSKEWEKPRDFLPDRWLDVDKEWTEDTNIRPKCPFAEGKNDIFESGGFQKDSLAYFPFSSGNRLCLGKDFALSILQNLLVDVFCSYHLDPVEDMTMEEDLGMSVHSVIVPRLAKSMTVRVSKVTIPGKLTEVKKLDDGWADEDDDKDEDKDIKNLNSTME